MREIRFISKYYLVDPYKERECKRKGGMGERAAGMEQGRESGRKKEKEGWKEEERKKANVGITY